MLSRAELKRLFAELKHPWQLIAQLQYGRGPRVTELLELRVQRFDLDRRRLLIFGGKGDKDWATVLAEPLVPRLRAQLEYVHKLFEQDLGVRSPLEDMKT